MVTKSLNTLKKTNKYIEYWPDMKKKQQINWKINQVFTNNNKETHMQSNKIKNERKKNVKLFLNVIYSL